MMSGKALIVALSIVLGGCLGGEGGGAASHSGAIEPPVADKATIEGSIVNDEQFPVEGAEVGLLDMKPTRSLITDATGRFAFTGLDAGTYTLAVQKLGYQSFARPVTVADAGTQTLVVSLVAAAVVGEGYHNFLVGQGYLACGAFAVLVTVSNLNACPWDSQHKPRYEFQVDKATTKGILQELVWQKNQALSTDVMYLYLWYNPVCSPTCNPKDESGRLHETSGTNPVRSYTDIHKFKAAEDPYTLSSMSFVGPDGGKPVALVYQQKLTHYITIFHNMQGDLENYTAIPDS